MASTSTLGTVRSNLTTQLEARTNLTSVQVSKYEPAPDDIDAGESIWLGKFVADQEHAAMGGSRFDIGELDVIVHVRRPGGGETAAGDTETRALVLFAEIETQLRTDPTINGSTVAADLTGYEVDNDPEPGNRVCEITGRIRIRTHLT